jgi:error-prone DNA polymerase
VKGLSRKGAEALVASRGERAFEGPQDLVARSGLSRRDAECLAAAGALRCLAGNRREAQWAVLGTETAPLPLLKGAALCEEPPVLLPPTEGEEIVADYQTLGLTLGRHPVALLRAGLSRLGMKSAAEISQAPAGRFVKAAGLVVNRQRPGTASGVTFVTLEDETGQVNVVVWRNVAERQRRELLGSRLLEVRGKLEREGEVVHLIAGRLEDRSALLGDLVARSRDFR